MTAPHRNIFGYGVAALGIAVVAAACVFLGLKIVDSASLIIVLVLVGCLLIAMGMYVVLPTETTGAIDQVGEVIDKLPFNVLRKGERVRSNEPPVVVSPAAHQPAIVNPPAGPPVLITPKGEAKPLERSGDIDLVTESAQPHAPPIPTGHPEDFGPLTPLEPEQTAESMAEAARADAIDALGIAELPPAPASKPGRRGAPQPDYTYPPGDA